MTPRAGWHYGTQTWARVGDDVVAAPRAARRAARPPEDRKKRQRYRRGLVRATLPPVEAYTVERPGTLRRQARVPLWLVRTPEFVGLGATDRARLLSLYSHVQEGAATTSRTTTAREIGRLACTVTRSDARLRAGGWLDTRVRRVNRTTRLPNETLLRLPRRLAAIEAEVRRRVAGDAAAPTEGLRDDDLYVAPGGDRRVRSALLFGWEIEHPDVQAVLRSPVAAQVWVTLRGLLASGPRQLSRLQIAELAGLVTAQDVLYAADDAVETQREARCQDARKRVSEAVVGLEMLGLVRPERTPGAASRYHLLVPRGCEAYLAALGNLCPAAWRASPSASGDASRSAERDASSPASTGVCPSCQRPAHFDRTVPADGWLSYCIDAAHADQPLLACPGCGAPVDGAGVVFDPCTGTLSCAGCDPHGGSAATVAPARRPGARVVGEPAIEDGPPPERRVVPDTAAERVVAGYLDALPPVARARRRSPRPLEAEIEAARVLVARGGVEHALWCVRRLAAASAAPPFLPADAAARVTSTA